MTEFEMWWDQNKESIMRLNMSPAKAAWDFQQVKIAKLRLEKADLKEHLNGFRKYRQ